MFFVVDASGIAQKNIESITEYANVGRLDQGYRLMDFRKTFGGHGA